MSRRLIAEFEVQEFTQLIFPHEKTDWVDMLEEAQVVFIKIINTIIQYQKCLVVCDNILRVKRHFKEHKNLHFVEYICDDTWARDCSAISVLDDMELRLLDFEFNAWGGKFKCKKDNLMSQNIAHHYKAKMQKESFILEGGAIDTNGDHILLTTQACMLNKNRNKNLDKNETTQKLKNYFGMSEIIYLHHGYLAGDDTDSHIDTLVRFIDKKTIVYVSCEDEKDEHYKELKLMEEELKTISSKYNLTLIPLPMPDAIYEKKQRLPATYANFLFINGAVLVPTYGVKQDKEVIKLLNSIIQDKEIIPINCSTLIKQHGSLHCVCMSFSLS